MATEKESGTLEDATGDTLRSSLEDFFDADDDSILYEDRD